MTAQPDKVRLAVAPGSAPAWMAEAARAGGARIVDVDEAEAIVWGAPADPDGLGEILSAGHALRWIQLPLAGIERYRPHLDDRRIWTSGKGVYAEPVAEMALALALAGFRHLGPYARAGEWSTAAGRNLFDTRVTILGGGGITLSLIDLLRSFRCRITVVRNRVGAMEGVTDVVGPHRLHEVVATADLVIVALALTPSTEGLLDREVFRLMRSDAWIVNVARGGHVVTDDLVWALETGEIGGAALDVTTPEPLPSDHTLWRLPNCVITPHAANTPEMSQPLLSGRISDNVRRFASGEPLLGLVDTRTGY